MNPVNSGIAFTANAEVLAQALWFAAGMFGAVLAVAMGALAFDIAAAWPETRHAPGADFLGRDAVSSRDGDCG